MSAQDDGGPATDQQLTTEQAIELHNSKSWESWTHEQIAHFQMRQQFLCVPFGRFHEAVEKTLGRPVWTHEFGLNLDGLKAELAGTGSAPSMADIVAMLPANKTLIVAAARKENAP
jgi:hypothetical protein